VHVVFQKGEVFFEIRPCPDSSLYLNKGEREKETRGVEEKPNLIGLMIGSE
jgi:hypothetical protein